MLNLNEFAKEVHANAVDHGWWDEERTFGEIVSLCHSELSEALEEYRAGRPMVWFKTKSESSPEGESDFERKSKEVNGIFDASAEMEFNGLCSDAKPEGVATELADCVIRILDWCGKEDVDLEHYLARFADEEEFVLIPENFGDALAEMHCDLSMAYGYGMYRQEFMARVVGDIFDWAEANDVDLERILLLKHAYNKGRPYRHGGKKL